MARRPIDQLSFFEPVQLELGFMTLLRAAGLECRKWRPATTPPGPVQIQPTALAGGAEPEEAEAMGARWATALRARYALGDSAAKRIARDFVPKARLWRDECETRTAEDWLAGTFPKGRALVRAWRLHGEAMVAEVLAPGSDWEAKARMAGALAEVERLLGQTRDDLVLLRNHATGVPSARCPGAQRLELFASARRPGWDAWGNEVGKFGEAVE